METDALYTMLLLPRATLAYVAFSGERMKNIKIFNEDLASFGVALEALVGTLIMVGLIALAIAIATGKW